MPARGGFSEQVEDWARRAQARIVAFSRALTLEVTRELVLRSPVGDPSRWSSPPPPGYVGGHFVANWQVSLGSPASGEVAGVDPEGTAALAAAAEAVSGMKLGDRAYVSNNLPYARRLEYGWSSQAPEGMVRVTLAGKDALIARALAVAKSEVP